MGLKMSKAFYSIEESCITVDDATERSITEELFCITKECRAALSFVKSYNRQYGENKIILVKGHFKLSKKGAGKGHIKNCKYNTEGRVNIIARDSEGILTNLEKNKYVFRLNLITSALKSINNNASSNVNYTNENSNKQQASKHFMSKGKIAPYLSTMKKVMMLRSEIEDNKELRNLIKLRLGEQDIPWKKFYYSSDDYKRCFYYVNQKKIDHPICIEGRIKTINEPSDKYPFYSMSLIKPWVEHTDQDGFKRIPTVSVTIYDISIMNFIKSELEKGNENISLYSFLEAKSNKSNGIMEYLNIRCKVFHKDQIFLF